MKQQLPVPNTGRITKLVHLADLHIRPGYQDERATRFDEYIGVFERVARFIHKLVKSEETNGNGVAIVIAGDVFHDHTKLGARGIELFYRIVRLLSKAGAPVYLMAGNHDLNASTSHNILASMMQGFKGDPRVAFLDKTGVYSAGNVAFGVVAIQDALEAGNTHGRVSDLPTFPSPDEEFEHRVALFHGDVPRTYPTEWIGGPWSAVLLGDLHVQHFVAGAKPVSGDKVLMRETDDGSGVFLVNSYEPAHDSASMMGYPGSTIQQNFGEAVTGHGFLVWDLKAKRVDAYHVKNDYGFLTLSKANEEPIRVNLSFANSNGRVSECWVSLAKVVKQPWFPQIVRVRLTGGFNIDVEELERLGLRIEGTGSTMRSKNIVASLLDSGTNEDGTEEDADTIDRFNSAEVWAKYIEEVVKGSDEWRSWLTKPETLLLDSKELGEIAGTVRERNKKIQKAIDDYAKLKDTPTARHTRFRLLDMEWEWILCFRGGNHFDFETLKGDVHVIKGKNGQGKTAFLETICIALFGEGFPSRTSRAHTASVINLGKPKSEIARTMVRFEVDGRRYKVGRTFDTQKGDPMKVTMKEVEVMWEDANKDATWVAPKGKKAVAEFLAQTIGTVEAFLTSTIVTQAGDEDFFVKRPVDQKAYIEEQLRLDTSTAFAALLKTAVLGYGDVVETLVGVKNGVAPDDETTSDVLETRLAKLEEERASIDNAISSLGETWTTAMRSGLMVKGREFIESALTKVDNSVTMEDLLERRANFKRFWMELEGYYCESENYETVYDIDLSSLKIAEVESALNETRMALKGKPRESQVRDELERLTHELSRVPFRVEGEGEPHAAPKMSVDELLEWHKRLKALKKKHGTLEDLEKKLHDLEIPKEPTMTRAELDNARARISKWEMALNELLGGASLEQSLKEVTASVSKNAQVVADAEHNYNEHLQAKPNVKSQGACKTLTKARKELLEAEEACDLELSTDDDEGTRRFLEKWPVYAAKLHATCAAIDEKCRLVMECDRHEYNPACQACMCHPMKLRLEGFEKECMDLKRERARLLTRMWGISAEEEFEGVRRVFELRMRVRELEEAAKTEKELEDWTGRKAELETALEIARNESRDGQDRLRRLETAQKDYVEMYQGLKEDVIVNEAAMVPWQEYVEVRTNLERDLVDWKRENEIIEEARKTLAFGRWRIAGLQETLALYERQRQLLEEAECFTRAAGVVKRRLEECEALIAHKKELGGGGSEDLEAALACIDVYERERAAAGARDDLIELRLRVAQLKDREARKRELDKKITGLWHKLETLKAVAEAFGSFKDWVLEHSVLPMIEANINRLLETMCRNHRAIALVCSIDNNGVLTWNLCDGGDQHRIPLEKASGFQRSVVSLAMRIVLGRLGFAGIRNTQLFIDEGFTACDADNLGCVPEVLVEMLGMYEAIVIVTHLEELQRGVRSVVEVGSSRMM